jgi:small basic protein
MENNQIVMIFGPLAALLRSRKVLAGIVTVLANALVAILVAYAPQLEGSRDLFMATLTALGMTIIAGIAVEDSAKSKAK